APRRRGSPGGGRGWALFLVLPWSLRGRAPGRRSELRALLRRKRQILRPALAELRPPGGALLGEAPVVLPRLLALLGREARPLLHPLLDALLAAGRHFRVALGDAEPALLLGRGEARPLFLERRKDLLLLGSERGPVRLAALAARRLRRRAEGHGERHGEQHGAGHHGSAACFFSQFWKPRSR